ncbi:hypothetical protein BX600DRAFT_109995 [Xylariales sp. PMI_506]|nr:hypothetical protein BX600DRAFT_109995 [Xylariales sp. PMI_506]
MVGQLPAGVDGVAALSLLVAIVSIFCSSLFIWLTWVHRERFSYVAIIAYYCLISTICSVIQQAHDINNYITVIQDQYDAKVADPSSPDLRIANGSTGMDLILYYIQFYCYNCMCMAILFWASELAQSVFGLLHKKNTRRILRKVNAGGKIVAILFPLLIVLLLRTPGAQNDQLTFTIITDVPFGLCLGVGSILMLTILGRYIHSRRRLLRFDPGRGVSTDPESQTGSDRMSKITPRRRKGVYDRWLMTRFSTAFVFLLLFQATGTLFQQLSIQSFNHHNELTAPDFSAASAKKTFYLFIPGNIPAIGLMIVFGTTAAYRKQMYKTFMPKRWQKTPESYYDDLPSIHHTAGSVAHVRASRAGTMKSLPARREFGGDSSTDNLELSHISESKGSPGRSIYILRTVSTTITREEVKRSGSSSSDESTPSLLIMKQEAIGEAR